MLDNSWWWRDDYYCSAFYSYMKQVVLNLHLYILTINCSICLSNIRQVVSILGVYNTQLLVPIPSSHLFIFFSNGFWIKSAEPCSFRCSLFITNPHHVVVPRFCRRQQHEDSKPISLLRYSGDGSSESTSPDSIFADKCCNAGRGQISFTDSCLF